MSVQKAGDNYQGRGTRRMNCCESVAYAFQDRIPLPEEEMRSFAGLSGGRAPEGYCGAVYAALRLLEKSGSPKAGELPGIFQAIAGSAKCREIKALKKISCLDCVQKASEIVAVATGG